MCAGIEHFVGTGEALILGVLQGLTEFLPVSSSGHMTLAEMAFGMEDADDMLTFDVAMHAATLLAIMAYFTPLWIKRLKASPALVLYGALACIPAIAFYFVSWPLIEFMKGSLAAVGTAFAITSALLILADYRARRMPEDRLHDVFVDSNSKRRLLDVLVVGLAQAAALLPGVSRSGSTISAGMLRGIDRQRAFEFSFLIGAPLIFGAVLMKIDDIGTLATVNATAVIVGSLAALVSGLAALAILRRIVIAGKLWIFGLYTAVLASGCLVVSLVRFLMPNGGNS